VAAPGSSAAWPSATIARPARWPSATPWRAAGTRSPTHGHPATPHRSTRPHCSKAGVQSPTPNGPARRRGHSRWRPGRDVSAGRCLSALPAQLPVPRDRPSQRGLIDHPQRHPRPVVHARGAPRTTNDRRTTPAARAPLPSAPTYGPCKTPSMPITAQNPPAPRARRRQGQGAASDESGSQQRGLQIPHSTLLSLTPSRRGARTDLTARSAVSVAFPSDSQRASCSGGLAMTGPADPTGLACARSRAASPGLPAGCPRWPPPGPVPGRTPRP